MGDLITGAAAGFWAPAFTLVGIAAAAAWCIVKVVQIVNDP